MAIKFAPKEPEPKPVAEKPKKADTAAAGSADEGASQASPAKSKAKKSGKPAAEKDDELF
jgi:hypothetical protein